MESLLFYLLRASIVMAVFYGFYKLLFGRNTFHKSNRALLILIVVITSILPLFSFNLLSNINLPESEANLLDFSKLQIIEQVGNFEQKATFPWIPFLLILFVAGMLFTFIRYIIGINQIWKIIASSEKQFIFNSEKQFISNNAVLCITDKNISPFSWWTYIVISRKDYTQDNSQTILSHEKAHIHMNHSMDMILFDLFTIFFWFNPFSWLLKREIQTVHEYMADEQVLNNGIDAKQYQYLLICKSVGEHKFALANNFRQRNLHKRITMMTKTKTSKRMKWNYVFALPVLFLAITALSAPKLNAKVVEPEPPVKIEIVGHNNDTSTIETAPQIKSETKGEIKGITTIVKDGESRIQLSGVAGDKQPLYIYDGVKMSNDEIGKINPNNIADITVLKDKSAVEMYGKEGEDGVIIINSKDAPKETIIEKKPLIIIDGEKMPLGFELNNIKPSDIESISVIKDGGALEPYGEEGKNGVIVIVRKK
jgi:beta-lactamase regulating signal transducer with metallopeptidase domain